MGLEPQTYLVYPKKYVPWTADNVLIGRRPSCEDARVDGKAAAMRSNDTFLVLYLMRTQLWV